MKLCKANTVDQGTPGWFFYLSTEEALLIRQMLGSVGQGSSVYQLSEPMRTKMIENGLVFVSVYELANSSKFRPEALQNIKDRAATIDGAM
jgi:hypothetical protein